MRILSLAAAAALASVSVIAIASDAPEPAFSAEGVRAHVEFLADDLLEGRDAGTRGYDIAARYVATEMEGLGLKPGNGESWYQNVPFVERAPDSSAPGAITIGGKRFPQGGDALVSVFGEGKQTLSGDAVFVGYGLKDAGAKLDDYAGLDVRGKTVVMLYGTPKGLPSDIAASLNSQKAKMAQDAGRDRRDHAVLPADGQGGQLGCAEGLYQRQRAQLGGTGRHAHPLGAGHQGHRLCQRRRGRRLVRRRPAHPEADFRRRRSRAEDQGLRPHPADHHRKHLQMAQVRQPQCRRHDPRIGSGAGQRICAADGASRP